VLNPIGKQPLTTYPLLRFLAALACFGLFSPPWAFAATKPDQPDKPDFSGTWTLDLRASTPLEPLLKEAGASIVEQKFATGSRSSTRLASFPLAFLNAATIGRASI
jgi:hypothetical protein